MPIFDQGYQHWNGALAGHTWRWLAITNHGVRVGMKSLIMRLFVIFAWAPALALAFLLCVWGLLERKSESVSSLMWVLSFLQPEILTHPKLYRMEIWTLFYAQFLQIQVYLSMILILLVGPNLISQDLRFNALPLYFSRPLRRIDYFLGKLGIIAAFLAMVVILPSVVAYGLGLLFSLDITIIRDTYKVLLASIAYGLVTAVSAGLLMLALSSLSRSSRYTALFWLGLCTVGISLAWVLTQIEGARRQDEFAVRSMARIEPIPQDSPNAPQRRRALQLAQQKMIEEAQVAELHSIETNWRPMVSYITNLTRIGERLLGTRACWDRLSLMRPRSERALFIYEHAGPQYPWHWSAWVLLGIFGCSAWILNRRVKSLDRLK
jgi:ABC-2 type transport system permease protein